MAAGRSYFGDFDPFGDFHLIFGAAKLDYELLCGSYRDLVPRDHGCSRSCMDANSPRRGAGIFPGFGISSASRAG